MLRFNTAARAAVKSRGAKAEAQSSLGRASDPLKAAIRGAHAVTSQLLARELTLGSAVHVLAVASHQSTSSDVLAKSMIVSAVVR